MIITNNEELLRVKCEDVLPEEVGPLREQLQSELNNSNRLGRSGIGLAAPQIGIAKKMAIVRLGKSELDIDLVNCRIVQHWDEFIHRDEGCLSFPGRVETVKRFHEIHVVDNLIEPKSMILTGLMAVCVQHELDHLNCILLPDRAIPQFQFKKVSPNDRCPCGIVDPSTGKVKKYKKCHGR
jgi:peptide deformylase